ETSMVNSHDLFESSISPYNPLYQKSEQFAASMRKYEPGPEAVSKVVQHAIETARPKARYLAGVAFSGRVALLLRDFIWDRILQLMFKIIPTGSNSV
ncbi:MAG TPA: hypothetical protein VF338_08900, partial [Leptolinea sp.]